jgi:hypothetical protein
MKRGFSAPLPSFEAEELAQCERRWRPRNLFEEQTLAYSARPTSPVHTRRSHLPKGDGSTSPFGFGGLRFPTKPSGKPHEGLTNRTTLLRMMCL